MKILYKNIDKINYNFFKNKNLNICIGNFETFHKGHLKLINKLNLISKDKDYKVLISFYPHPSNFFNKNYQLFYTKNEKEEVLKTLDIDLVLFLKFDYNLKNMEKLDFINFLSKINTKNIVVGKNFYFSKDKSGNIKDLKKYFKTHIINLKKYKNEVISSKNIKVKLKDFNIEKINKYLYKPYFIISSVIKGNNIGEKLGFKTANLKIKKEKFIIKKGSYITKTYIKDKIYNSITNIGINPSISKNKKIKVETHLLNYHEKDFYNEIIKVEFLKYLRNETKFNDKKDLIKYIKNDKIKAVKYFEKLEKRGG